MSHGYFMLVFSKSGRNDIMIIVELNIAGIEGVKSLLLIFSIDLFLMTVSRFTCASLLMERVDTKHCYDKLPLNWIASINWVFSFLWKTPRNSQYVCFFIFSRSTIKSRTFKLGFHSDETQSHQGIWLHFSGLYRSSLSFNKRLFTMLDTEVCTSDVCYTILKFVLLMFATL